MKAIPLLLFLFAVLVQWAAPLSQIWTHERVLADGALLRLKCAAPDPYDPLRGRYLAVRPVEDTVASSASDSYDTPLYVTWTTGEDGLARLAAATREKPTQGDFVKVLSRSHSAGITHIRWPFDRFYINEKLAPEADKWFAETVRNAKGVIAEVRVLDGRAVLQDLTFDGKSFREILKGRLVK